MTIAATAAEMADSSALCLAKATPLPESSVTRTTTPATAQTGAASVTMNARTAQIAQRRENLEIFVNGLKFLERLIGSDVCNGVLIQEMIVFA